MQKTKSKTNVFWAFYFYKTRAQKDQAQLSQFKPKRDRISSTNFNYAPKPYKANDSKINKSNGRPKTQPSSLNEQCKLAATKDSKEARKVL